MEICKHTADVVEKWTLSTFLVELFYVNLEKWDRFERQTLFRKMKTTTLCCFKRTQPAQKKEARRLLNLPRWEWPTTRCLPKPVISACSPLPRTDPRNLLPLPSSDCKRPCEQKKKKFTEFSKQLVAHHLQRTNTEKYSQRMFT